MPKSNVSQKQMKITYNNKDLTSNAKLCNTLPSRILGLMFSKPKAAILKTNRESITASTLHTLFMRFPLDIIWLNKNLEIVDFKNNVKPYRLLIAPKKKAMYVIELPAKGLKLTLGKKVKFL